MTEFGFIENIKNLFSDIPKGDFEGIGDDCAVLPIGGKESLLFTSDMLVEGVHFTLNTISPFDLGQKSLAVNLSDVAAMGAPPVATLLSLSLPKDLPEGWVDDFMRGYHAISSKHNVALIGGDTTASVSTLSINVTAIGRAPDAQIKRRCDAKVGDIIAVTGRLGDSAVGLKELISGARSGENIEAHRLPTPRIAEGVWLGRQSGVHAVMDISDGVASDIRHILKASGVGAQIDIALLPTIHDPHTALCGGEDYELLMTLDPAHCESIIKLFNAEFTVELTPIGEIVDSNNIEWRENGLSVDGDYMGFRHF